METLMRRGIVGLAVWLVSGTSLMAGPLEDGRAAYEAKDYKAAYEAYAKAFRENPDDPEAAIGVGLSAKALGLFDRSEFAFERALSLAPANHAARMELARVYLAMNMPEVARLEYQRLLDSAPPPAIRRQIEQEMGQAVLAGKRVFWTGRLTVEGLYDSNVRFSPARDYVDTRLGLLQVADDGTSKDAFGGSVSVAEDGLFRFGGSDGWGAIAGAGATVESLVDAEKYAAQDMTVYAGVRYATASQLLDVPLRGRYLMMDWERLVVVGGVNPVLGWVPSERWRLYTAAGFEKRDFDDDPRDSLCVNLSQTVRRYLGADGSASLSAAVGGFREDADLGGYDREGLEVSLAAEKRLPWKLTAAAGAGIGAIRYDEVLFPLLQDEARDDTVWKGSASLSRSLFERWVTTLAWFYEQTDSNFDLYSYRRHEVRLGATVLF